MLSTADSRCVTQEEILIMPQVTPWNIIMLFKGGK
jgi:hypothetical protein